MLTELVPSEVILQELDSTVKALPTVARCPVNPEHKAVLHPDNSSVWAACQECGFTGDSIDILRLKFKVQSVESVVLQLEQSGHIKSISRDTVAAYQMSKAKRTSWAKFIEESKQRLVKNQCDRRILAEFNALPPFRREWEEGFGKFAGAASRTELHQLLGTSLAKTSEDMLVLPYYDMPGRPANLRIVSYNSRGLSFVDKPMNRAGGLFMMETVPAGAEYAIAVDDPMIACKLQMHRMNSVLTPLPIVAWHPDLTYWPITPKRTVFWAPIPSVAMFNQARKVMGACICTPSNTVDFDKILQHKETKNWVHHVLVNSRPWVVALKEHLLAMDQAAAIMFAKDLDITPLEIGELLFECTQDEKQNLAGILDLRSSVKNVMVGDTKVIERDNAWWTHTEKGRLIRVLNATFSLEKSAHYDTKGSYLIGSMNMNDKTERFMAPASEFMSSPTRWLRAFGLRKGMGLLQTYAQWDNKLVDIATSLNPEKMTHVEGKAVVGWSPDMTKFSFPNVTLTNGRVDECDLGLPTDDMPCVGVTGHPTQRSTWKDFMEDTSVNRVFWSTLAGVAANICAKHGGYTPKRLGIIGPQRNMTLMAATLDMQCIQASPKTANKINAHSCHDVPIGVLPQGPFKSFIDWLDVAGVYNIMVNLSHPQAALIGGKSWLFIDARDLGGSVVHFKQGANILADVIRMVQTRTSPIDPVRPDLDILKRMYAWGKQHKCEMDSAVFEQASKLLIPESIYGALNTCEVFLYSLFAMIQEDQVSVSRAGFSRKVGEVELAEKHVRVSKNILQKMLAPIGTATLTAELGEFGWLLKSSTSEWYLNKEKWEELYAKWAALNE